MDADGRIADVLTYEGVSAQAVESLLDLLFGHYRLIEAQPPPAPWAVCAQVLECWGCAPQLGGMAQGVSERDELQQGMGELGWVCFLYRGERDEECGGDGLSVPLGVGVRREKVAEPVVGVAEAVQISTGRAPFVDHVGGGVTEGEWEAVEFLVERANRVCLVEARVTDVGETTAQEGAGLVFPVRAQVDPGAALAAENGVYATRGGQDSAVTGAAVRPPLVGCCGVGDVVQHDQPPLPSRRKPRQERLRRTCAVV